MLTIDIGVAAAIVSVIAAVIGFGIAIGRANQRIVQLEGDAKELRKRVDRADQNHVLSSETLVRIDTESSQTKKIVESMSAKLDDLSAMMQRHLGAHGEDDTP